MKAANDLAEMLSENLDYEVFARPTTGVVLWRPRSLPFEEAKRKLFGLGVSTAVIDGEFWFRCVASNPMISAHAYFEAVNRRLRQAVSE